MKNPSRQLIFLHVNISSVDNKLETDLFCKPTDCHQFLHFNSAHPFHNKKSIVYKRGIVYQKELKNWFCRKGYPQKVVD